MCDRSAQRVALCEITVDTLVSIDEAAIKGVVNCQNSRDKGPPEGNSARG